MQKANPWCTFKILFIVPPPSAKFVSEFWVQVFQFTGIARQDPVLTQTAETIDLTLGDEGDDVVFEGFDPHGRHKDTTV